MKSDLRDMAEERQIDRREHLWLAAPRLAYRSVEERGRDFNEACLGFTPDTARAEAARCIQCPAPQGCVLACPLHNDIPSALWEISEGNFSAAADIFRRTSNFPDLCGRLCPDESQCTGSCGVRRHRDSIRFQFLTEPVALIGESRGYLTGVECRAMRSTQRDGWSDVEAVENSSLALKADLVILAPERGPDRLIGETTPGLEMEAEGWIVADDRGQTTRQGVFGVGDNTADWQLAVVAIAKGRKVASSVHGYLR